MEATSTARHAFVNRVRSLFNIDRDMLPELTDEQWPRFRDAPALYLMKASDDQVDAIWREVERRQARRVAQLPNIAPAAPFVRQP